MNLRARIRRATPRSLTWRSGHARLGYWNEKNFGDLYSPQVVECIFGIKAAFSGFGAADLVAVGSLLEMVQERVTTSRPTIWGTGFIRDGGPWAGPDVDFRAVRGYLSLDRIGASVDNVAVGDPGILAGFVYPETKALERKYELSLIPHFHEMEHPDVLALEQSLVHIIDPRNDPQLVAREIASSEFVLSSSLHGLIFSDGLGIPNAWVPISGQLEGGSYKFRDYYSIYDLDPKPSTLRHALQHWEQLRAEWSPRPGISGLQDRLIASFPLRPRRTSKERR